MNTEPAPLKDNALPTFDWSDNPTNCCPRFNPQGWDDRDVHLRDKLFVQAKTKSVMHVPVNMGRVFAKTLAAIESAGAQDTDEYVVLSRELSPWSAEHFFAVTGGVPGQEMVRLSGDYHTKVFEGPYKDMRKWCEELARIGKRAGKEKADTLFFYTTCPGCANTYGENYVVGFVEN